MSLTLLNKPIAANKITINLTNYDYVLFATEY